MKAIVTVGCSASGKTTWSQEFVEHRTIMGEQWYISSRDDIRTRILDLAETENLWENWNPADKDMENKVTNFQQNEIRLAANNNKNIIVCDTHVNQKTYTKMVAFLESLGYRVTTSFFTQPSMSELIERDRWRTNKVGAHVIMNQWHSLARWYQTPNTYSDNESAVIVDLDGTLALNQSGRDWFATDERLLTDTPNKTLARIVEFLHDYHHIIFLSGRKAQAYNHTVEWINKNLKLNGDYTLLMRSTNDDRADEIVKAEIFNNSIDGRFSIECVFDDRPKVVEMWHDKGLRVFACADQRNRF